MTTDTHAFRTLGDATFVIEEETQRYRTWRLVLPDRLADADLDRLELVANENVVFESLRWRTELPWFTVATIGVER